MKLQTKEQQERRTICIVELNKLEKRFGTEIFRNACNRKLMVDSQRRKTEKEIRIAEKKIEQLKGGNPLPQY
jgi:hypothetical protein